MFDKRQCTFYRAHSRTLYSRSVLPVSKTESSSLNSRDVVDDRGLEVDEDCPGHVLALHRLLEEGVEGVVAHAERGVGRHGAVGLHGVGANSSGW